MRRVAGLVLCSLVIAACSASDTSPSGTSNDGDVPVVSTTAQGNASADTTTLAISSTTTLQTSDGPVGPAVLAVSGAEPIVLLTESGTGTRPILTWEPVAGVSTYAVFVYTADGEPYWAAETTETELPVGGAVLSEGASGPRVDDGYQYVVFALDADGSLITSSEMGVLTP